jgi:hypothetical protein
MAVLDRELKRDLGAVFMSAVYRRSASRLTVNLSEQATREDTDKVHEIVTNHDPLVLTDLQKRKEERDSSDLFKLSADEIGAWAATIPTSELGELLALAFVQLRIATLGK